MTTATTTPHPVLVGVDVSSSAEPGADPVGDARAAEALGFDFVSCSDHPAGRSPTFETWTLLSWLAAATTRIAVMPRVLGVPFRVPALVAKMAESLDRLTGGRLVLGLGAGADPQELRAVGVRADSGAERVVGLADAVRIVRGLWREPTFTHRGAVYSVEDAPMEPKPARTIPIWLGTFGPRALAVTGALADGWIPSLGYAPAERLPAMRAAVLDAAARAGRRPDAVTCALNVEVAIGTGRHAAPGIVSGSVADVADQLRAFVDVGFTAFNIKPTGAERSTVLGAFADSVLPVLRAMER